MTDMTKITGADLVLELEQARHRIDRYTSIMLESLDIREDLLWSLDLDDMVATVADFKRRCRNIKEGEAA
jgi:hypothetical protein